MGGGVILLGFGASGVVIFTKNRFAQLHEPTKQLRLLCEFGRLGKGLIYI